MEMITVKDVALAINRRCKQAMILAGYDNPRVVSVNMANPLRPSCETMVTSETTAECSNRFLREFVVTVYFYPQSVSNPEAELQTMDDCMTLAFCQPIPLADDVYDVNEAGIKTSIEGDDRYFALAVEMRFDTYFEITDDDDLELMETLYIDADDETED